MLRTRIQRRDAERAAALIASVAIVALVIGPDFRIGPGETEPSQTEPNQTEPSQTEPRPTGGTATGPAQTPGEAWDPVELPPLQLVADLTPTTGDGGPVSPSTAFTLKSLTGTPAAELAGRLRAIPLVDLAVEPGATPDIVTVRPTEPLAARIRYRFELLAPDGSLAASWLFRTASPTHAVTLLPRSNATGVPVNTGIEVTFDQDSPIDFESHFSIEPQVAGRFEVHGRTWAFVPAVPLAAATVYTVTVSRGVGIQGSDQVLESDVQFAFETAPEGGGIAAEASVHFLQPLAETRPGETPAFEADVFTPDNSPVPATLPVEVYRLPSLSAAVDAAATLQPDYSWAQSSSVGLVDTAGLERVAELDAPVSAASYRFALALPTGLPTGWYLIAVPRQIRDAQVLLQVTDLAVYTMASRTRTVTWLNDLAADQPVEGGAITLASGTSLGTTGAGGLLNVATPVGLEQAPTAATGWRTHLLVATAPDGRNVIAPVGYGWDPSGVSDQSMPALQSHDAWWHLLATDRAQYRSTDTVHVWGVIRSRSDRSVPADAELRLWTDGGPTVAPIFKVAVHPTARGVFTADVPLVDLPNGDYFASVVVGEDDVATTSFQVTEIRKPAYRIDVMTDHQAYLVGEPIASSATVAFYDGTAAPGIALRFSNLGTDASQQPTAVPAKTSGIGNATATVPTVPFEYEGYSRQRVNVVPSGPEEGEISGSRDVVVFKSRAWLAGSASLDTSGLTVNGTLSAVDFEKVDRAMAANGQVDDPAGAPIVDRAVTASIVRLVPEHVEDGSTYDFISKKVVPRFVTRIREEVVGNSSVTSGSNGRFSIVTPVPTTSDGYRVVLTSHDRGGRAIALTLYVSAAAVEAERGPYLEVPGSCGYGANRATGVDERFTLTVHEADGSVARGRFLFLVGRQGITDARISDTARWSGVLPDAALPGFTVTAIRVSGAGYDVTNELDVQVRPADKTLKVTLAPQQNGYRPGDTVTVHVQTARADGSPIAADVVVRGVDEKLYALGAAFDIDAVSELMAPLSSGYGKSYASHRIPRISGEGCGAGGGSERDDFRDAVTFQRVSTDGQGRGSLSFKVPDDLTSWHLAATAVSEGLDTGSASVLVPVGLPFFVEAGLASEYLVDEQPVLRLRAYGDDLEAGQTVQFEVSAPTLGLASATVDGTAFVAANVHLPKLPLGDHRLRIDARRTGGSQELTDTLIRIVHVVPTRLDTLQTRTEAMTDWLAPAWGRGLMTTYVVSDAGRGTLLGLLHDVAADDGARFDQGIGSQIARDLLIAELGVPAETLPPASFDITTYLRNGDGTGRGMNNLIGLSLLPYSPADLALTARAAVAIPDRANDFLIRTAFSVALADGATTREGRIMALAGKAALGDDVASQLEAIDPAEVTIREQLWLALGLQAVGDAIKARDLERSLLAAHGERLGPWVRLSVGTTLSDIDEASALMLLLSAKLGDPIGADLSAYLRNSGSREELAALDQIAYARSALERLPRTPGRFAWSVDGERHEEGLEPGGTFALTLTDPQSETLVFERLAGDLAVSASWLGPATGAALPGDPQVTIVRIINPDDDAPTDQLVWIRLSVTIAARAPLGCYEVTEFVPSGLAPASLSQAWVRAQDGRGPIVPLPYEIEGQRASWCLNTEFTRERQYELYYSARVVSPGTYTWEPAVVQLVTAPTIGNVSESTTYTIR